MGHFGDLDKGIPVEDVENLRAAVDKAKVDHVIYRYADADHGFPLQRSRGLQQRRRRSWRGVARSEWLTTHIG
jgi:carboxymethylenebutenolidase